ncbi:thiamine pyrophosphate-dependent enzyme [Marimonas lutisalis]|uniref:thiamine pyrophosphate-dependent enzyme n=1 Tax=Marimonas lutisalis TaxID=2545756 RepID=UPI0010F7E7C2|nr:thiamine pyrophosphate-dependent enzyme [Marimonas lutisalis]
MKEQTMDRRAAVAKLLAARNGALVVTGLGSPSYDVHAAGDSLGNFYLWGAMGGAALTGLGLAQAQPDKRVMVITGDGEMLMALGAIATIAVASPRNLDIIVLDNQQYGETGMQASHTARGIELDKIAAAAGFSDTGELRSLEEVEVLTERLDQRAQGPRLFVLKINAENLPRSLPPRDAVFIKNRFRAHLGYATC